MTHERTIGTDADAVGSALRADASTDVGADAISELRDNVGADADVDSIRSELRDDTEVSKRAASGASDCCSWCCSRPTASSRRSISGRLQN